MTTHAAAHGHGKAHHPHEKPHHPHWPLAAVLFGFVFALGVFSVHDSGTWINIRTGARILETHSLPTTEPFSYTAAGRPWTTGAWLSDVLFFLAHRSFGPQGLIVLKAALVALAFALLVPINPAGPLIAATVLAAAAVAAWPGLTEKPALFDLPLLALAIRLLRPRKAFRWAVVGEMALLEFLWANLHGARAILGVWLALLKAFKVSLRTTSRERLQHAAVPAAALFGLACNPHGLGIVGRALAGLGTVGGEWSSLSPWLNLYALFVVAGGAACAVCLQQEFFLSVTAATLLVFSLFVPGLRAAYLLSAAPVICLALGHAVAVKPVNGVRFARWLALLGALFWLHWTVVYAPLGRWKGYSVSSLEGALHFLKDNGVRGRLFNEAAAGAAVIGESDRPVFVDERSSVYEPAFVKDAARWPATLPTLAGIYRFDYALVLNRRAGYPARVFDVDPSWRLAYADDAALVYLSRLGANAPLLQNSKPRLLAPNRLWPDSMDEALRQPRRQAEVLSELDHWVLEAPDAVQPLLWKAYALDRLKLADKADRWLAMAQRRPSLRSDPELLCAEGLFYERRSDFDRAERLWLGAAQLARRRADAALEGEILSRLADSARRRGEPERARSYEDSARSLAAPAAEE